MRGALTLSSRALLAISLVAGAAGWLLLPSTPASVARLVPLLVLFPTAVSAYGSIGRTREAAVHLSAARAAGAQVLIAVFSDGVGFLIRAALTLAGLPTRNAGASENVLAGATNAAAVASFAFSPTVARRSALVLRVGTILSGLLVVWTLTCVDETLLRVGVVAIGAALTIGLFPYPV